MATVRDRKTLREAAAALEAEAKIIFDSNKEFAPGTERHNTIVDADVRKTHESYVDLARRLRAMGRR